MNIKVWLLFLLTICLLQVAVAQEEILVKPDAPRGYLVGPGDEITGKVLGEPQFDFVAEIDQDGNFKFRFSINRFVRGAERKKNARRSFKTLSNIEKPQISVRVTSAKPSLQLFRMARSRAQRVESYKKRSFA
jgi:hypothetical protein